MSGTSLIEGLILSSLKQAHRLAFRLTGNDADSRELVQEALYRALLAWDSCDPDRSPHPWFMSILRHAFLDDRKRYERRNSFSLDFTESLADKEEGVQDALELKESARLVRRALGRLSRRHREVLILRGMDGLKHGEIAARLGLTIGAVKSRFHRGRKALSGAALKMGTEIA